MFEQHLRFKLDLGRSDALKEHYKETGELPSKVLTDSWFPGKHIVETREDGKRTLLVLSD